MNQQQNRRDLATLERTPRDLAAYNVHYRRVIAAIHADRYLTPGERRRQLDEAKAKQRQTLASVRAQCEAARDRLMREAALSRGEAGRHNDPARALLEAQAWQRIRPVIERQPSLVEAVARLQELIAKAGREGDLATLRAINTEMPAYLEAREHPQDRARRLAAGKSFDENGTLQRLQADVAAASAAYAPLEEVQAFAIEQQLRPYETAITANLERCEQIADDPHGPFVNVGLIAWTENSYIPAGSVYEEPAKPNGTSAELPSND